MRILCLHGAGTNSRIFEMQTAAIRYELADSHVYDFVEGTIPWSMYPGVETIALDNEPVFAYFDDKDPQSGLAVYQHFEQHLRDEGPYDGVIAFSQAATMILTYLIYVFKRKNGGDDVDSPFRFAVLFSVVRPPIDYEELQKGKFVDMDLRYVKGIVEIPTVHVWGALEESAGQAAMTSDACRSDMKWTYVHDRGHEIPGAGSKAAVTKTANAIRRAIETASDHLDNKE
ncbi:hypothetical protein ALT_4719 [Aspergillus lentulus]|uniref:Serine hydrolase domain-containing protein n=1 Tax=Aspergillus lentulus TaxID=293939 RepID=A0AAN4PJQ6_ASPLE|nr:uncharacterized protein IFM58399_02407 [Aspergillus lentulus]KAF4152571.1 hypothetical protein CNMCM6069_001947 [Aspergillus lentulus]KAF4179878.1 hypothetical protein CNMCM7927_001595 [Aspergillus lentulus]GAQ07398.1 hypothetical protein ALT_4719 [Aspergillus lentulus]GFF29882.1 hypothetical protein IFM58399_02407 [Aspergillus lentulus]GFF59061.1 hypothetical protein IFM62136_04032 [Aspergillus lentulus]